MSMMRNKTFFIVVLAAMLLVTACADTAIDRHALVMRNNPHVTKIDSLHSLTVGNGRFAFTADATGFAGRFHGCIVSPIRFVYRRCVVRI